MSVCLRHVEAIVRDRFFFMNFVFVCSEEGRVKETFIIIIIIYLLYRNLHMEYIVQQIKLRMNCSDCT